MYKNIKIRSNGKKNPNFVPPPTIKQTSKKKRLVPMTNKEYAVEYFRADCVGKLCPRHFYLENENIECDFTERNPCQKCWNLPAKIEGKYIMKKVVTK